MNACFQFFLDAQAAQGKTREQAIELLKKSWEIEDREKVLGWKEIDRLTSRLG